MLTQHKALYHIVLRSVNGKKFLTRVNQDILYNYVASVIYNKHCTPVIINGHSNHMHVVVAMIDTLSVNQLVKEMLQNSEDFIRRERSVFPEFPGWEKEYRSITYHPSQVEELTNTVKRQFDFHRTTSFEEEMEVLFEKGGI
jgi:REP element-mobilizing transposase RayT